MDLWIPTPCLNAFWHGRPYIPLHFVCVVYTYTACRGVLHLCVHPGLRSGREMADGDSGKLMTVST